MKTLRHGWLAASLALAVVLGACGSQPAAESGRGPASADAQRRGPSKKRLFLESHAIDDAERAELLAEIITSSGTKCEAADKVVAVSSGSWTVRCRGGAVFRVLFDRDGKLSSVRRVN